MTDDATTTPQDLHVLRHRRRDLADGVGGQRAEAAARVQAAQVVGQRDSAGLRARRETQHVPRSALVDRHEGRRADRGAGVPTDPVVDLRQQHVEVVAADAPRQCVPGAEDLQVDVQVVLSAVYGKPTPARAVDAVARRQDDPGLRSAHDKLRKAVAGVGNVSIGHWKSAPSAAEGVPIESGYQELRHRGPVKHRGAIEDRPYPLIGHGSRGRAVVVRGGGRSLQVNAADAFEIRHFLVSRPLIG